jgi:hypothetical protein
MYMYYIYAMMIGARERAQRHEPGRGGRHTMGM